MLVDFLLQEGFQNITVLDISASAIDKEKARLGEKSNLVKWVVSDITDFKTDDHFDLWHDRATFHFLTRDSQIAAYLQIAGRSINNYMVQNQLKKDFEKIRCINEDHITPFQTKLSILQLLKQSIN
ncbi:MULTISPECIES: class I SAM-dependent methyltransferase [unclassified Mucilaginibacter]|uniref:class I SAM-dependent methyltransferase n=1 Tax=unclassified Mucilaginibacter TaxID=2617802 RepID=UPI002AC9D40E|nr:MULTISPECIES: class I SAM-dependent methyltransferase [unclassified Mucilaginibacter]MEB0260351.1 class I SAM-dependent methyltransferase [Mucilaginibacter sp. 10I4]MEB0279391.1 class I SAM-dependent methyltransferase [Mucilaginibacter sp. 10B2]MEB0300518.1 class I SAM-dependent methyltransferase [Mucilaginibacter sp. 5C4]WPX21764.1 class I SAM-dependent methyltransferase [Mucilaginibacter sp. 5C4]